MKVLHSSLPFKVWLDPRLARMPGILPLDPSDWLHVDEVYAQQMAERERLLGAQPNAVHALLPGAQDAAAELYEMVAERLPGLGFVADGRAWIRPDGKRVQTSIEAPLLSLGHLAQEDFCILQQGLDGHHVLTGAVLCFPASWTLSEKIGKGLPGIHSPVQSYDAKITTRVQRMFDAIRPEQPLWRANALDYSDPSLHQPRRADQAVRRDTEGGGYIRSERQSLLRLPRTRAVVFSIHTYIVRRDTLSDDEELSFAAHRAGHQH